MAENLQSQLKEVGSNLQNPPATKDALITLLTEAAGYLSGMDQSPTKALLDSMQTLMNAIVKPEYLKHQDEQVKLLAAVCTCEITRITAPDAPYDDDVLKDIFHLFVSTFKGLKDTKDPSFGRIVNILDTVAKYRSFVVMLDLECDDLVNEMFKTFFSVASDEHTEIVTVSMETIMAVLLEESEDIGEDLLLIVLSVLGRDKKDISAAARKLGMSVIRKCAGKLEPGIKQFILSSMSGASNHDIDYHEVIYDIYRCAPQILKKVVPTLTKELLADKVDLRLKTVRLVGDLFADQKSTIPKTFNPIFMEFLRRMSDNNVEVRMSVLEKVKLYLLSDPFREDASKLLGVICDRLLDDDESIRKQAVAVVLDVASHELSSVSSDTVKLLAARLEDQSILVKKYTLERLSDIYRIWCLKQHGGLNLNDDYDWIPGRILKCSHDKDLGLDTVEQILCMRLFPAEFSVKDKVKKWVKLFSIFDEVEVKALEKILEQKQRLQQELNAYLSHRQTYKENDAPDLQKKTTLCIRSISNCFVNPTKAEADFQLLDQSKDIDNIWKILTTLLDATTSSLQSRTLRDELVKVVDEKHPLYELLTTLSIKCSYTIFDKEYVKDLVVETDLQKCDRNKLLTNTCMNILTILGCFSPLLLSGMEEDLAHLLEDDDEVIKEGALHVLAKAGETIREQSGESSSSLDLILEKICLEGSRKQAKYAVHALAAITKDQGLKSLSVLYKRLVDMLEKKANLPSVLQSLGCIAQIATPVFETQESKVVGFIRESILSCSQKSGDKAKESWDAKSELCSLKIFGIKTLVKSYLPVKDAHLRVGIDELLKDLQNLLSFGEISKDIESSSVDKAHLKLASAKGIIRLSKHWDKKIPINIFHLTVRISEVGFPEVKKLLLLSGMEEDLAHLLEDDDEVIKEGALHVLAKAGETIREQSGESSSSLDLILEKICLEGSRKQAKYAVHALAAITKDQGLKSLSVLYKRLVDMLEKKANLPSVLQSLGCIAQIATPVFETQESKVVGFIRESILSCSQKSGDKAKESWDAKSELCSLKIFGIKTLVKSYLPVKDAHLRVGIDELLKDLQNLLSFGEISKDIESSSVDKAHLKLASAKGIIRLSKHWDKKIPINIFHLTVRISEVGFPEVKKLFLNKVHQYIKDKSLDSKYVCAFLLDFSLQTTLLEEENQNLNEVIKTCDPKYILPYLVHALAHHLSCPNIDECKDIKAYEPIYKKLYMFFSRLACGDEDGKSGVGLKREDVILVSSVVRSIKRFKDAVDDNMTKNSYAICDLCLSIAKRLARNKEDVDELVVPVSLPQELYTPHKNKESENKEDEKKEDDKKEEIKEDENKAEIKEDEKKEEIKEDAKKEKFDTEVAEGKTWLTEENALAYFDSLILDANGNILSKTNEDDTLKDSETDGNDVPLGKLLKRLKAKGSKAKKVVNNGSTPAVVEAENNIDILGMLKEINSDNADVSNKFDSSNGHGKITGEAKLKRKSMTDDLTNVSVPKRRRSSSSNKSQKRSTFVSSGFKSGPAFNINKMEDDSDDDKVTSRPSTDKATAHKKDFNKTDDSDLEPKKHVEADNNQKLTPVRKRKRRRVSVLAKCTSDDTPGNNDLVGKRIKVWWPMDKTFYKGVVKSYDRDKKKHAVLYDDGDTEVLNLEKERWELIEKEHKFKQLKRLSNSPPSKKKIKSSGSSKKTKELTDISPSSAVRGKRTPRKNLKQGQKGVSQRAEYLEIEKSKDLDTSMPDADAETDFETEAKPTTVSKDDSLDTGEGKPLSNNNRQEESSEGEEKHIKDAESSSSDTASSQETKADSVKKAAKKANTSHSDGSGSVPAEMEISTKEEDESDNSESESTDKQKLDESDDAEFPDDEPLGVWKARVGKSVKGK